MSNQISSPYADYIQEQKKQKYLKNIDVLMISSYHVEFYKVVIELQKSIINTLHKNKNCPLIVFRLGQDKLVIFEHEQRQNFQ